MVGQGWEVARTFVVVPGKGGSAPVLLHVAGEDLPRRAVPLLQKCFFCQIGNL